MYIDSIKEINNYEIKEYKQSRFKQPLTDDELEKFSSESLATLNYKPCSEYIDLLRLTNGFEWNGIIFYNCNDFLLENVQFREIKEDYKNFIVFGSSGSTETYTYNIKIETYNIANTFGLGAFETFKTFGELVTGVYIVSKDEFIDNAIWVPFVNRQTQAHIKHTGGMSIWGGGY